MVHGAWRSTALAILLIGAVVCPLRADEVDDQTTSDDWGMRVGPSESTAWSARAEQWGSGSKNESPADVKSDIEELKEQHMMAAEFEPTHLRSIEHELACAQVRLKISELRVERDEKKKGGYKKDAAVLNEKIQALKTKLAAMKSKSSQFAKTTPSDKE